MAKPPLVAARIGVRRCTHEAGRHVVVELFGRDGAVIADAHLDPATASQFCERLIDTIEAAAANQKPLRH